MESNPQILNLTDFIAQYGGFLRLNMPNRQKLPASAGKYATNESDQINSVNDWSPAVLVDNDDDEKLVSIDV